MKSLVQVFFVLFSIFCFSQDSNWYAFYNPDSTKLGFRDSEGNIKIEPKYETYVTNRVFKNVIVVIEKDKNDTFNSYYLNRKGEKFGENSVYMSGTSDIMEDPEEYDGIIKFRNPKTGNVGFFDADGNTVIPDIYNDITNFHNGIAFSLRGATWPKCNSKIEDCEHLWWQGGKAFALNIKGEELFEVEEVYSSKVELKNPKINKSVDTETHKIYKGSDGNTYAFCIPEKDFKKWFETVFITDFKRNKTVMPIYFYELISVDDNDNPKHNTAWKNHKKEDYIIKNQKRIDNIFYNVISGNYKASIRWEYYSNNLYYPENILPKEDLRENITISYLARKKNSYSAENEIEFTKIGDSFYITSAP